MILGVLGDTHGNRPLMHQAVDLMLEQHPVDLFFHLGDDYGDAEELAACGYPIRMVPGLWCPQYHDGRIPNRLIETIDGLTVAVAHADKDLGAAGGSAAIVLTGHTHAARICLMGGSLHVNPGHLKAPQSRRQRASCAIITIDDGQVRAAILETSGKVRAEKTVARDALA
jgi:putative phosphoesterase